MALAMHVQCELCPKQCLISPGQSGECRVRINDNGVLRTVVYGYPCAIHLDPVEKKPLFHFLPASSIVSIATVGCNLHCQNCQNWNISQANPEDSEAVLCAPDQLVALARQNQCPSIAYTYTDPVVYYEYTLDCARLARDAGIRNVLVTAGYINQDPWRQLLAFVDAANIDLKSISDDFYRRVCDGTLRPVQDALVTAKAMGVWVEVTNLVIPTLNDDPNSLRDLSRWIYQNLGEDTPLHFSGFVPRYKMRHLPGTSSQALETARQIARDVGLKYVYIGNVMSREGQNTYCPSCKGLLVERSGFHILQNRIKNNNCPDCNMRIQGVWQ
jgi:pyruvate formate lyase activating enzyme